MSKDNKKDLVSQPSDDVSHALAQGFPAEQGFTRVVLPRLTLQSQDVTEGKGKSMKVVREAGTFIKEYQSEETDENGKAIWAKNELGTELEVTIVYQRRQLKYYNPDTQEFTSSTIYDSNEDIIPLFSNKAEVARGNVAELKAKYNFVDPKDNKTKSKLEDNKILYVLYEGEIYQMALRGSSMYSAKTYLKENPNPSILLTKFSSEPMEKGTISWSKLTLETLRKLSAEEAEVVLNHQNEIRQAVADEKAYFASINPVGAENPKIPSQDEVNKFLKEKN